MIISTPFPPEEGIGYHVYNISKRLIEKGNSVTVFTRGDFKTKKFLYDGIKIIEVPYPHAPSILYPFQIKLHSFFLNRLFKSLKEEYDIVNLHLPFAPLVNTDLPIITTMHGSVIVHARHDQLRDQTSFKMKIFSNYVLFPLVNKVIKNSDIITTVSNPVAKELDEYYGLKNVPICGNGVDENLFKPCKNEDENYILYVGRLSYKKGLFNLINVFEKLCNEYSTKLLIVGKGEIYSELYKDVLEKKLNDKIIFCGHKNIEELVSMYQKSTLFISPSHYESGPLTLLEAMSCGKPVIATNVGIAQECINNYENGLLIKPKSLKDMRIAIANLIDDRNLRVKLGKNARKTILDNYTWDKVVNKYEICYNKIVDL